MSDAPHAPHAAHAAARPLHGIAAEYETPDAVLAAARAARRAGYRKMDAYTPHPVEGLAEVMRVPPTRLGYLVLAAGLFGVVLGYGIQYFGLAIFYPLNIGGRPLNSWPNYIVISYEVVILLAAFTAGIAMIALNGLPRPYHSIFNAPGFERASQDRYFLCIEAVDPRFDTADTRTFLEGTGALAVVEVER
jgi:hypothetical protein